MVRCLPTNVTAQLVIDEYFMPNVVDNLAGLGPLHKELINSKHIFDNDRELGVYFKCIKRINRTKTDEYEAKHVCELQMHFSEFKCT